MSRIHTMLLLLLQEPRFEKQDALGPGDDKLHPASRSNQAVRKVPWDTATWIQWHIILSKAAFMLPRWRCAGVTAAARTTKLKTSLIQPLAEEVC